MLFLEDKEVEEGLWDVGEVGAFGNTDAEAADEGDVGDVGDVGDRCELELVLETGENRSPFPSFQVSSAVFLANWVLNSSIKGSNLSKIVVILMMKFVKLEESVI